MKKLLSILAIMLMISLTVSSMVFSVSAEGAWDGVTAATEFAGGTGTAEDPYLIATPEQFKYLANLINGNETNAAYNASCYKLTADIDLGGKIWYRIGENAFPFSGTFDGDGHTISNFIICEHPAALFGNSTGATFKNIKVDYADILGVGSCAAGLVANAAGDVPTTIENCEIGARVKVTGSGSGSVRIGGILGSVGSGCVVNVSNCINRARIVLDSTSKADSCAAGICGSIRNGSIRNCVNLGSVYINYVGSKTSYAGGIVGNLIASGECTIENVINCANVSGYTAGGGIIGFVHTGTAGLTVTNAFSISNNIVGFTGFGTLIGSINDGATCAISNATATAIQGVELVGGFNPAVTDNVTGVESIDALAMNIEYNSILTMLGLDLLTMPVLPPEETEPDIPVLETTTPEDTGDEPVDTPADTGSKPVDTPADTGDKTEPTTPVTDPSTPGTDPETEKPAEGGCGSVVAGGIAILAVVTLAGVALKKKD